MARSDRKQREFDARQEDILKAALELFAKPNWESVTIEQVADAADIGKGTLYKHFSSKDELLFRLMMRFYRGLLHEIQQQDDTEKDLLAQFRHTFEVVLCYHDTHREYLYIIEYCKRIDFKEKAEDSWHASFLELDAAFSAWATPKLEALIAQQEIEARPIETIQIGLHAAMDGAINLIWGGKDWCMHGDIPAIFESCISFLMTGLIGQPEAN